MHKIENDWEWNSRLVTDITQEIKTMIISWKEHTADSVTTKKIKFLTLQSGSKWQEGTSQLMPNSILTHSTPMELKGNMKCLWQKAECNRNMQTEYDTKRRAQNGELFHNMIYNNDIVYSLARKIVPFEYTHSYTCAILQIDMVDPAFSNNFIQPM